MSMPAAAKRQLEEAEAAHKATYQTEVEQAPDVEATDAPPVAEVPPPAPEAAPEPKAEEPPKVEEKPAEKSSDWEQKYKTLQGKYNKEVPQLSGEVRDLQRLMATLQPPEPIEKKPETNPLLTEQEIADYGEDMISVVRRAAREEIAPEIARLKSENEQLRQHFGGVTETIQKSARQTLLESLDRDLPDWRTINKSDAFLDWLEAMDTYSGSKRHALLLQAFEENDVARTMAFFNGYLNEHAAVTPRDDMPERAPTVSLDTLTAPGTPRSTGTPRAQEGSAKKQWTQREIADFYAKVTAGKYRGKEKEKTKIEKQIIEAGNEGRISL